MYLKKIIILLLSVILLNNSGIYGQDQSPKDVRYYLQQAARAYREKNYSFYLENLLEVGKLRPEQPTYLYNLAGAYALNGQPKRALELLDRIALMGLVYNLNEDKDFVSLKEMNSFKEVVKQFEANKKPINKSISLKKIPQKDLITESIAFDPETEKFYLSSVYKRKIVVIDKKGITKDFSTEEDGLWSAMGLKIDAKRRHLWVCTAAHPQMINFKTGEEGNSAIFKYDLDSGKLLKKYHLPNQPKKHWLGDLVINRNGDVFATDSLNPLIFVIRRESDKIELFAENEILVSPQGLDFSPDEKKLFVADYAKGLFSIDLQTKKVSHLSSPKVATIGVDGLYFYKGNLIGIQNGTRPHRIVRFKLSKNLNKLETFETLEIHNPLFDEPTLGMIWKDTFFFIANSQWGAIDKEGKISNPEKLKEPVILKMKL